MKQFALAFLLFINSFVNAAQLNDLKDCYVCCNTLTNTDHFDPKKDAESKSHFLCQDNVREEHNSIICGTCKLTIMLNDPEKRCPQCSASGSLKIQRTINSENPLPIAGPRIDIYGLLTKSRADCMIFIDNPFNNAPNMISITPLDTETPFLIIPESVSRKLVQRWVTVAQKNPDLLNLVIHENATTPYKNKLLQVFRDNGGKLENLINQLKEGETIASLKTTIGLSTSTSFNALPSFPRFIEMCSVYTSLREKSKQGGPLRITNVPVDLLLSGFTSETPVTVTPVKEGVVNVQFNTEDEKKVPQLPNCPIQ